MDILVQTYLIYLAICVPVILLVGWTLHRNGRVFLVEIFEGKEDLADSINHLFIVGFYLASIGFVSMLLRVGTTDQIVRAPGTIDRTTPADAGEMIEVLSMKIGLVLIVLGGAHLLNLVMLALARRKVLLAALAPRVEFFRCPTCNSPTPLDHNFCVNCGRQVPSQRGRMPLHEPNAGA
ncbi:MAG TPA: hypothetical protein VGR43_11405 [Dehalococcoidia bacterium]|jgi:hypothetical protein|nr:hypothetical protein [Dehalococcoidia bacterium]